MDALLAFMHAVIIMTLGTISLALWLVVFVAIVIEVSDNVRQAKQSDEDY